MDDPREATEIDQAVGSRIKARRLQLGMSQTELADAVGVTFQQIQKYERGANRTSASRILALCRVLKVTPNALLTGYDASSLDDRWSKPFELMLLTAEGQQLTKHFCRISSLALRRQIVEALGAVGDNDERIACETLKIMAELKPPLEKGETPNRLPQKK